MSCQNNCNETCTEQRRGGSGFVILVVLYILLAIILGSCICY